MLQEFITTVQAMTENIAVLHLRILIYQFTTSPQDHTLNTYYKIITRGFGPSCSENSAISMKSC